MVRGCFKLRKYEFETILTAVFIGSTASANALVDYSLSPSSTTMSPSINISNLKQQSMPVARAARRQAQAS